MPAKITPKPGQNTFSGTLSVKTRSPFCPKWWERGGGAHQFFMSCAAPSVTFCKTILFSGLGLRLVRATIEVAWLQVGWSGDITDLPGPRKHPLMGETRYLPHIIRYLASRILGPSFQVQDSGMIPNRSFCSKTRLPICEPALLRCCHNSDIHSHFI